MHLSGNHCDSETIPQGRLHHESAQGLNVTMTPPNQHQVHTGNRRVVHSELALSFSERVYPTFLPSLGRIRSNQVPFPGAALRA